jgi:DNA-binding NtrC family response regulator
MMNEHGKPAVLIIDDDKSVLDVVGAILRKRGWYVETGGGGTKGIRNSDSRHFDLVLTDHCCLLKIGESDTSL